MNEVVKVLSLFALVFALLFGGIVWMASTQCERQWAKSGLRADWGFAQGCIVQRKDGTWVPASAIRDLGQ